LTTAVVAPPPRSLAVITATPPTLFLPHPKAAERFFEFFTANIRNKNTRRTYYKAACRFAEWCEGRGLHELAQVKPLHVAAYLEVLLKELSKPTVKQHLAALRMLFDWLVVGHVLDVNPAHAVRGPKHVVKKGRTPVLEQDEARALLAVIDISSQIGLRDRALIGTMIYTFARVNAVLQMNVADYFTQGRRGWVRLHEKGGKEHEPPMSPQAKLRSIDTATLKLLAAWKTEDATTDPEKLREADEEIAAFKKAMNENRAATGARLLFP